MIRFIIIFSSRSSNHPCFPRNQLAVEVGLDGIRTKAKIPTMSVMRPYAMISLTFNKRAMFLLRSRKAISNQAARPRHGDVAVRKQGILQSHRPLLMPSRRSRDVLKAHGACRSTIGTKLSALKINTSQLRNVSFLASGMKPPCSIPSSALHNKKENLPLR